MNRWKFDNGSKKKLRGLRRRFNTLEKDIVSLTNTIPDPNEKY